MFVVESDGILLAGRKQLTGPLQLSIQLQATPNTPMPYQYADKQDWQ